MKKSSILVLLMLFLFGCKKMHNESTTGKPPTSNSTTSALNGRDPSNSNNIYDEIGESHNEILDVIKIYYNANPTATEAQMIAYVENWALVQHDREVDIDPQIIEDAIENPFYTGEDEDIEYYLNQMNDVLDEIPSSYTNSDYVSAKNDLIDIENDIINDATLNSAQESTLLAAASVLRHSLDYWWDVAPNTTGLRSVARTDIAGIIFLGWSARETAAACSGVIAVRSAWEWLTS